MAQKGKETTLIHSGRQRRLTQGVVNPVIQRASSVIFESVAEKKNATRKRAEGVLYYGRRGTLTHFALQEAMCELEGGVGCVLYPCGAAAISNSILAFVKSGDHVLMTAGAYEPAQDFCHHVLQRFQVNTTFFDPLCGAEIADLIQENTRVVFLESPSSVTMEIQDIPAIVQAVRAVSPDIVIIIDNTWAVGLLLQPLALGVDISIQSGSKYLTGHSDSMLGTAVANERCWENLREFSYLMGQMVDADTAYMAARGLRTLPLRLKQHQESSLRIARWLAEHPAVARVNHPALPSCAGHEIYLRDFSGCNGLFSFELKQQLTDEQLAHYLDHFRYFSIAFSWGGFESLVLGYQPENLRAMRRGGQREFTGTLIRLHIGLENVEDLIDDLNAGFERINERVAEK